MSVGCHEPANLNKLCSEKLLGIKHLEIISSKHVGIVTDIDGMTQAVQRLSILISFSLHGLGHIDPPTKISRYKHYVLKAKQFDERDITQMDDRSARAPRSSILSARHLISSRAWEAMADGPVSEDEVANGLNEIR